MRYNFSAEFLRVTPPDTSFGDAWESLCFELLSAEYGSSGLLRLRAPDGGIDILRRQVGSAFQCKSDERGALGSLSAADSIKSLKAAVESRASIQWENYLYATNANYTGSAVKSILAETVAIGIDPSRVEFLGPEHWDGLCAKHDAHVKNRFDFRVTVTEAQVIEAFRKARYYDEHVRRFGESIARAPLVLKIKNNRTPVELEVPFAADLSVENCVDAVQELLGISLKWTNFSDLGTSTGPSISLTVDQKGQSFKQTIGAVQASSQGKDLVFWITLVWEDEMRKDAASSDDMVARLHLSFRHLPRSTFSESERRERTLQRAEEMVRQMIWTSASKLKAGYT
jgi:hypothetical protein